jgi:two-component system, OmpR family, response regulator
VRNVGRIALDENSRKLVFDGLSIDISPLEYRMIAYLIDNRDRVVAPIELALHVQGREDDAAKNAVEAMVARLRRKTAPDVIKNRRGFGYIIADEHE